MQTNNPEILDTTNPSQEKHEPTLPSCVNEPVKHYRYPGPDSFQDDETDRRIFFGRKDEVTEVLNRLLSNKLLVLFAKSGLGKTSLLQAGLFPKLREDDFLPICLRFNHRDTSLLEELNLAVSKACKDHDIAFSAGEGDTYWEYFNTVLFSKGDRFLTPILILDQFEEIFTLQIEDYRVHLGEQLGDLVSGQIPNTLRERIRAGEKSSYQATTPNVRLLISLREDWVGALQELVPFLPGILSQRFRLTQLDRERARDAIVNPAQICDNDILFISRPFTYQTKTASQTDTVEAILEYLQDKRGNIEPFQLQLLCRHIELKVIQNQAKSAEPVVVDLQSYFGGQEGMGTIIKRFYQNAINTLSGWRVQRKARALCETGLLNPEGRRESLSRSQIKQRFGLKQKFLDQLVEQKVLRREERLDSFAYELSHDSLALAVYKTRRAQAIRNRLVSNVLVFLLIILLISTQSANLQSWLYDLPIAWLRAKSNSIPEPKMIAIPPGKLTLGNGRQVDIKDFRIGQYELTFAEYDVFVFSNKETSKKASRDTRPQDLCIELPEDNGWGRGGRPVINVSWSCTQQYLQWLNERIKPDKPYLLPSETQWEYAIRAGTTTDYYWNDQGEAKDFAWYNDNSERKTHPVGELKPNAFGLYDMSGNVWEWVQDCWNENYDKAPIDGSAWESGSCSSRVLRGGSWHGGRDYLRSANRHWDDPGLRYFLTTGFRLAQD